MGAVIIQNANLQKEFNRTFFSNSRQKEFILSQAEKALIKMYKVISEKDNVYTELVVKQNRDSINQYGFLQEIIKIDTEKENAETGAAEKLNELCKVGESYSFEIIEKYDSYTRAGETLDIDGVQYVIESTSHNFKDGQHYNKLDLRKI